jgi:hypothetical protein
MYFQRSALLKPKPSAVSGVAVIKPRKLRVNAPRATLESITGVNVVVGTVAVALAVDTLAVFWKKYQQRKAQQETDKKKE